MTLTETFFNYCTIDVFEVTQVSAKLVLLDLLHG